MPGRRLIPLLLVVGGLAGVAAIVAGLVEVQDQSGTLIWAVPFLSAYVGGVIAVRARPDNLAARRLLLFGVSTLVWLAASDALLIWRNDLGGFYVAANALVQVLGLLFVAALVAMLAVYPDGVIERASERRAPIVLVVLAVAAPLVLLLASEDVVPAWIIEWYSELPGFRAPSAESPLFVGALSFLAAPLRVVLEAGLAATPLIGAVLAARRYRAFPAAKRLQLKWPFYAALVLFVLPVNDVLVVWGVIPHTGGDLMEYVALIVLPAALTIGLVRPDLFDLESAVRRSVVYVGLWVVIALAYVGVAAGLGIAAGGENLQVAVAVAILATLVFDPVRRALAGRAERYAYGERIGGEELLRRMGAALEHTLDRDELVAAVAATAREGIGSRWARIVLADGSQPAVAGPDDGDRAALSAPLTHGGEVLGVIECGPSAHGRIYGQERELLATLARQAALAIANAQLAGELRDRLAELAASRSRIVEAEELARRRIERDIHDGAQQELAALIARIGLARNQLRRGDVTVLADTLGDLQAEAGQALENLRRLASGIHPSVLSDRGVIEAIEARAARLPLGVTLECEPGLRDARYGESVEGAIYFLVSESFANTLKHAGAERVTVRIARDEDRLVVEISDDGDGFDPAAVDRAGGIAGLRDRLAALGGTLEVDARPGGGTRLRAALPAAERAHA